MTMPSQITGVHTVGVPVTDQDRAIDSYVLEPRQCHFVVVLTTTKSHRGG